jgi:hypothetical protein
MNERERESERKCVCVRESASVREYERGCVRVCVGERERESERGRDERE